MPLDPDTEIQYRKGGKIMKKTPRKFAEGGAAPTSTPKPPPPRADRPSAENAEKMRQQAADAKMDRRNKQGYEAATAPDRLKNIFKRGGKVRKFADGGETQAEDKDIFYTGRFEGKDGDEIYRRAYAQANRLTTPSGAEETGGSARTGLKEPSAPKVAPKSAPSRTAPKVSVAPSKRAEGSSSKKGDSAEAPKKDYGTRGNMRRLGDVELQDTRPFNPFEKDFSVLKGRRGSSASDIYPSLVGKKAGGKVSKYAKGGGIESKGKTQGKIVKMAKGGSVRGYGVSKVTNKTKYV